MNTEIANAVMQQEIRHNMILVLKVTGTEGILAHILVKQSMNLKE